VALLISGKTLIPSKNELENNQKQSRLQNVLKTSKNALEKPDQKPRNAPHLLSYHGNAIFF